MKRPERRKVSMPAEITVKIPVLVSVDPDAEGDPYYTISSPVTDMVHHGFYGPKGNVEAFQALFQSVITQSCFTGVPLINYGKFCQQVQVRSRSKRH